MHLDVVSILSILLMGQCLFLMGITLSRPARFQVANLLWLLLLFSFLWIQLEFFFLRHKLDAQIPFLYGTRYGSWFMLGPLIYLYHQASTRKSFVLTPIHFLHFLPFLVFTLILPLTTQGLITHRSVDYGMLTVFDAYNQETLTPWHYLYASIFLLQFLHAAAYIGSSLFSLQSFKGELKRQYANLSAVRISTLQFVYVSTLIALLLCSAFVIYIFTTTLWRRNMDYLYVLPMLLLVFGIAYRSTLSPSAVWLDPELASPEKYAKSGLTPSSKVAYLQRLEHLMEAEKWYRKNDLKIHDLAEAIGTSVHHLSQLINEELNQHFFDYINSHRIAEAKELISQGQVKTFLEIAYAVGFNNKNSFNNAFKRHTGMTPTAYKKSQQNG